jgi:hypothetical protein
MLGRNTLMAAWKCLHYCRHESAYASVPLSIQTLEAVDSRHSLTQQQKGYSYDTSLFDFELSFFDDDDVSE